MSSDQFGRILPLTDPFDFGFDTPECDVRGLPPYARNAMEWWHITDRIWPAIMWIAERLNAPDEFVADMAWRCEFRERALWNDFNTLWTQAPDAYYIHTWPQWERFCDLCSEGVVLFEGDEQ